MKVKADASGGYTILYGGTIFDDADLCVTVQVPNQTGKADQLAAGPVFWAEDYNNYYTFAITPGGSAAIIRRSGADGFTSSTTARPKASRCSQATRTCCGSR